MEDTGKNKRKLLDSDEEVHISKKCFFNNIEDEKENIDIENSNKLDASKQIRNPANLLNNFRKGLPIGPAELLLYCLTKLKFKNEKDAFRAYSADKFKQISQLIETITEVFLDPLAIKNYFHRAKNNVVKNLGKIGNGRLRWVACSENISSVLRISGEKLIEMMNHNMTNNENSQLVVESLQKECVMFNRCLKEPSSVLYSEINFQDLLQSTFLKGFDSWKAVFDMNGNKMFIARHGLYPAHADIEICLDPGGAWKLYFESQERDKSMLDWADLPMLIKTYSDLNSLLQNMNNWAICKGVTYDNFSDIIHPSNDVAYKTRNGNAAAFIEIQPSNFYNKIIRSSKCSLFIPKDEQISKSETCDLCKNSEHYLRTLKSKKSREFHNVKSESKFTRLDYLSHDMILEKARKQSHQLKYLNKKILLLKKHKEEMSKVGNNTDGDLKHMFKSLNESILSKRARLDNPVCKWAECTAERFDDCELLLDHCKKTHIPAQNGVVPTLREYVCKWEGCTATFSKMKNIEQHLISHTGSFKDEFFEILLKDQAKALSSSKYQMRWHPLVIKWCLRLYNKSHSSYNDLRNSGVLRLPSGRTLNDYRNFNRPQSGWDTNNLGNMKSLFQQKKIQEKGKLGAMIFDEVKIKEGLVFDPSTFELIGFVDTGDENFFDSKENSRECNDISDKFVATHVLQFYFKSLFADFSYPCAYFLTRGVSAIKLSRIFWQGVSVLNMFGFDILVCICDGAPENRKFFNIIGGFHGKDCIAFNTFSKRPLFLLPDPPHLIKKLRNNLFNSGSSSNSKRFTRLLTKNGNEIVWDHVVDVWKRDQKRDCYVTKLKRSNIDLDCLSKMRVKLAVEVLSENVSLEMKESDNERTIETQQYISQCAKIWSVFNSCQPLSNCKDDRLKLLEEGLDYFNNWNSETKEKYDTKKEQSKRFITWQTMFDLKVASSCLQWLVLYISTKTFKEEFGEAYVIPKRLSQDIVESYFSVQRQMGGGNRNMTAFCYGYNAAGVLSYRTSDLVSRKQTNVAISKDVCNSLDGIASVTLPKRAKTDSIFETVEWFACL